MVNSFQPAGIETLAGGDDDMGGGIMPPWSQHPNRRYGGRSGSRNQKGADQTWWAPCVELGTNFPPGTEADHLATCTGHGPSKDAEIDALEHRLRACWPRPVWRMAFCRWKFTADALIDRIWPVT